MVIMPKKWAILPFAFIQLVALSANYYIVPQFIVYKLCHNTFNQTVCNQLGKHQFRVRANYIFEKAAVWNALVNFAGFFPAALIILPLGAMTDLVSKKKMLLLPAIFSIVSCLINICSSIFVSLHMGFIVLASFVTCIFGEVHGCVMLCCAYAASAGTDDRGLAITMTIGSIWFGFGIGGLILNYLTRYHGYSIAFLFATISLVVNLLYALILLPALDDIDKNSPAEENYSIWIGFKEDMKETWIHLMSFIKKHLFYSKDHTILLLLIAAFFFLASYSGERVLITLFLKSSPLSLKEDQIGIYITIQECSRASGVILLALIIKKYFRPSDYTLMFIGIASMIVTYTVTSFSKTTLTLYLSTIPSFCHSFMSPAVRSKLIQLVEAEEYGAVLSFMGIINVLCDLIVSPVANALFAATVKVYSGLSILTMSSSCLVCLAILCYVVYTREYKNTTEDTYHEIKTTENGKVRS